MFSEASQGRLSACLTHHVALWLTWLQPCGQACCSQRHCILWPLCMPPALPEISCFCCWSSEPGTLQNVLRSLKAQLLGEVFHKLPTPEGLDMCHVILGGVILRTKKNWEGTAFCIIFEFQILRWLRVPGISTTPSIWFSMLVLSHFRRV